VEEAKRKEKSTHLVSQLFFSFWKTESLLCRSDDNTLQLSFL